MKLPTVARRQTAQSIPHLKKLFPEEPWLHFSGRANYDIPLLYTPAIHHLQALDAELIDSADKQLLNGDLDSSQKAWNMVLASSYNGSKPISDRPLTDGVEKILSKMAAVPFSLLKKLWSGDQSNQPAVAYLLPRIAFKLASAGRIGPALHILKRYSSLATTDRPKLAAAMAANAVLCAQSSKPSADLICRVIDKVKPVREFGFVTNVKKSLKHIPLNDQPRVLQAMVAAGMDLTSIGYCEFLRALCSSSDAGGEAVAQAARTTPLPPPFYSFLMSYINRTGDTETLNVLCEQVIPRLAAEPGSVGRVLHLVLLRTLETGDLQTTAQVLARWPTVVPERTWMRVFQEFRYLGRPDKCEETLRCALRQHRQLRAPFVGEYLAFFSQFYNVSMFGEALLKAVPQLRPTLENLDLLPYFSEAPLLTTGTMPMLTPDRWVNSPHFSSAEDSWIDITYGAVLNGIEDPGEIRRLYDAYETNALNGGSANMRTIDQFVKRLVLIRSTRSINIAEEILRDALNRLPLKVPANGSYSCMSLEVLSDALTHPVHGDVERALRLVSDVFANSAIAKRGRALQPVLARLDPDRQVIFRQWATSLGAIV